MVRPGTDVFLFMVVEVEHPALGLVGLELDEFFTGGVAEDFMERNVNFERKVAKTDGTGFELFLTLYLEAKVVFIFDLAMDDSGGGGNELESIPVERTGMATGSSGANVGSIL
jgi:hypothetical protein